MSANEPLVSIVTPSYNQGRYLEEAMRSVLEQGYPRLEYLVVDGGSDDGSVDVLERYSDRLAWWASEPDAGQAAALNKGFERASGEILGWLSSDDTLLPGAVRRIVDELQRDPDAMLAYGEALFVDEDGREIFPLAPRPFDVAAMVRACANHVVQPGSLFRRRALELTGPLNEDAHYLFDFEFALALWRAGGKVVRVPERVATYRVHAASKSGGGTLLKARDYVRFADSFLAGSGLPGEAEGRASAYLAAGDYFYAARRLGDARRYLLRSLVRRPSRRGAGLLTRAVLRSLAPR